MITSRAYELSIIEFRNRLNKVIRNHESGIDMKDNNELLKSIGGDILSLAYRFQGQEETVDEQVKIEIQDIEKRNG